MLRKVFYVIAHKKFAKEKPQQKILAVWGQKDTHENKNQMQSKIVLTTMAILSLRPISGLGDIISQPRKNIMSK